MHGCYERHLKWRRALPCGASANKLQLHGKELMSPAALAMAIVGTLTVGAGTAVVVVATSPPASTEALVTRVIDGDTIVARIGNSQQRVRLLNIDAPESVKPGAPVECLGPESSKFAKKLMPAGLPVRLEWDGVRNDRYGRKLAAVFLPSGTNVSAEVARVGLAVHMDYGHHRFAQEVADASAEAARRGRGLFDRGITCTAPARVGTLEDDYDAAEPLLSTGTTAVLSAEAKRAEAMARLVAGYPASHEVVAMEVLAQSKALKSRLKSLQSLTEYKASEASQTLQAAKATKRDAKAAGAAKAAAKAKVAAKAKAAAKARAAKREAQAEEQASGGGRASNGGPAGYENYTGCRAYNPGGKTWEPISC